MVDSREVRRRALQDADLKKLRRKLLFRFLLLFPLTYLIGVAAMALVIDGALQDPFARFFLALAQALGGLSEDQSLVLYHNIFRDHKGFWTALLLVCIFFSLFFLLLQGNPPFSHPCARAGGPPDSFSGGHFAESGVFPKKRGRSFAPGRQKNLA